MSHISTHVLDLARGKPASGILVNLHQLREGSWVPLESLKTNQDGRARFENTGELPATGSYRLIFETKAYLDDGLYPEITITFQLSDPTANYHLPLLLSPNGYTTYRGS